MSAFSECGEETRTTLIEIGRVLGSDRTRKDCSIIRLDTGGDRTRNDFFIKKPDTGLIEPQMTVL